MEEIITKNEAREIGVITDEIQEICRQAKNMAVMYAIEIGKRLTEAKNVLPHGEWGEWLQNKVNFSQSTANNYMKLAEEFGNDQISIFGDYSKSQTFGNLSYSKAIALLGLPAEDRMSFVEEVKADDMSVRELQEAIRERNQAREEAAELKKREQELEERLQQVEVRTAQSKAAEEELENLKNKISQIQKDLESQKQKTASAEDKYKKAKDNPKLTDAQMKSIRAEIEIETSKKIEKEKSAEIDELRKSAEEAEKKYKEAEEQRKTAETKLLEAQNKLKTASPEITKFKTLFDELQKTAQECLNTISTIRESQPELAEKLKKAIADFGGRLNDC